MNGDGKRVALVTGANRGLGRETAAQLAALGYRVVVAARDATQAETVTADLVRSGADASAVRMDLADPESIAKAAAEIARRLGRLDVLVNNAGIAGDSGFATPLSKTDVSDIERVFATNTLGSLRVTQAFLPLLAKSDAARIVNVSSGMGQLSEMAGGAASYRISKTALNAVTRLFAHELADTPAKVNAVCPGWVRTDMGGPTAHRSVDEGARGIVWAATLGADGPTGGFFRDGKAIDW